MCIKMVRFISKIKGSERQVGEFIWQLKSKTRRCVSVSSVSIEGLSAHIDKLLYKKINVSDDSNDWFQSLKFSITEKGHSLLLLRHLTLLQH